MKIYAHRGASFDFPEHSREAYLEAVIQGADGFECDLRLTKDRQLICWHDRDTQRMSGKKLNISKSTFAELKFAKPLLFSELLNIAQDNKKDLALETKHPVATGGAVEKELFKALAGVRSIEISIMSFSKIAVNRALSAGFSGVDLAANKFGLLFNRASIVGPGLKLIKKNPSIVSTAKAQGRKVYIWTVNEPDDVKFCYDLGVDVIMSDTPAQARRALGYS